MAGEKFLKEIAGIPTRKEATQIGGSGKENLIPALDNTGRFSETMMPVGLVADVKNMVASEDIGGGDLINVWNDGGVFKIRKADASNGRNAHAFILASVLLGNSINAYFEGIITGLSGQTPVQYWLDGAIAGKAVTSPPSNPAHIIQKVGMGISATERSFEPGDVIA